MLAENSRWFYKNIKKMFFCAFRDRSNKNYKARAAANAHYLARLFTATERFYLTCRLAALSKAATAVNDNTSMTMPKMVLLMAKFTTASKKTSAIQGGSSLKSTLRPLCRSRVLNSP
jgi:hypothetical protein